MERSPAKGVLLAVCASVLWGTVPIAGTVALGGITAATQSTLRLLLAAAFLAAFLRARGAPLPRPSPLVLFAGLCLAGNYLTYMWGLERAGPATSQVLIQTAPLFLVVLGVAVLGERPKRRQYAGGAVALVGVFLVAWEPGAASPKRTVGVLLIFLASIAAVILTLQPVVTLLLLLVLNALDQERVPHEALTIWKTGGAALVVSGVAVTVSARS